MMLMKLMHEGALTSFALHDPYCIYAVKVQQFTSHSRSHRIYTPNDNIIVLV